MNVDLKIASKAIAYRLKQVIPELPDQTAYVKGRYIGGSVRVIEDILDHVDQENVDGILFEKAFDSIEHNFIFSVLKKFGFGPDFVQWIKTMFCNARSCVMNNGNSTGYFSLERGTRQGDPLSPYLFMLVLESLFIQIRADKTIKGFRFRTVEVKLTAYADNTTFLVRDVHSLKHVLKIMHKFEKYSSLRANVDKCESCWIGIKAN